MLLILFLFIVSYECSSLDRYLPKVRAPSMNRTKSLPVRRLNLAADSLPVASPSIFDPFKAGNRHSTMIQLTNPILNSKPGNFICSKLNKRKLRHISHKITDLKAEKSKYIDDAVYYQSRIEKSPSIFNSSVHRKEELARAALDRVDAELDIYFRKARALIKRQNGLDIIAKSLSRKVSDSKLVKVTFKRHPELLQNNPGALPYDLDIKPAKLLEPPTGTLSGKYVEYEYKAKDPVDIKGKGKAQESYSRSPSISKSSMKGPSLSRLSKNSLNANARSPSRSSTSYNLDKDYSFFFESDFWNRDPSIGASTSFERSNQPSRLERSNTKSTIGTFDWSPTLTISSLNIGNSRSSSLSNRAPKTLPTPPTEIGHSKLYPPTLQRSVTEPVKTETLQKAIARKPLPEPPKIVRTAPSFEKNHGFEVEGFKGAKSVKLKVGTDIIPETDVLSKTPPHSFKPKKSILVSPAAKPQKLEDPMIPDVNLPQATSIPIVLLEPIIPLEKLQILTPSMMLNVKPEKSKLPVLTKKEGVDKKAIETTKNEKKMNENEKKMNENEKKMNENEKKMNENEKKMNENEKKMNENEKKPSANKVVTHKVDSRNPNYMKAKQTEKAKEGKSKELKSKEPTLQRSNSKSYTPNLSRSSTLISRSNTLNSRSNTPVSSRSNTLNSRSYTLSTPINSGSNTLSKANLNSHGSPPVLQPRFYSEETDATFAISDDEDLQSTFGRVEIIPEVRSYALSNAILQSFK